MDARRRRGRRHACATPASASRPTSSTAIFEMFTQVDRVARALAGRPRHRPHAGQAAGRDARRHRRGAQRRRRARQRVRRAPAGRVDRARGRATAAAPPRRAAPRAPHRILVVDDNRDAASSLAMLLEIDGHRDASSRTTGPAALEAAEQHRPDVVLLDIGLPGMNGYEVGRAHPPRAVGHGADAHRADRLGPGRGPAPLARGRLRRHLVKPVDPPALLALLDEPRAKMSAD